MVKSFIHIDKIKEADRRIRDLVKHTPLIRMPNFSEKYEAEIFFKREDLQRVRSYKIRGAFNKIRSLVENGYVDTVVCSSAGNHAQGVAQVCNFLSIKGIIFMPTTTPQQKVQQVEMFGRDHIEIKLVGDTYDASYQVAREFSEANGYEFVHPFDDEKIIEGQGTVALEILKDIREPLDYILVPVGGGGLISGLISVLKQESPQTRIIAVEPEGAPSLKTSLNEGVNMTLNHIEKFVDGAAVKRMGDLPFSICKEGVDEVLIVPEGKICTTLLQLYNEKAIVVEPAGALSVAALDLIKDKIKGKRAACIISGGNNDISRMEEIKERSLLFEGVKHYFIVIFPQRAGALKEFVVNVLGETDDITYFEYTKKNSRARSSAVVGIELKNRTDFDPLLIRMKERGFFGEYLNDSPQLFQYII
ncbi:threonine ammonia-lyase IlvA [Lutimonas zeaxanthinifaciens]|uniref:threonine ammonia-lyase IlvA n=1 Tax=Lutimonas zeaxanthinifaciens TaxID=3060215 RepID=UPI00265CDA1B|nr:threonine ammonia-lyase IlvA [Lutimonas sp. YSD2104]WKK65403.1 threonine ammonia-lyase IlvA [Lutimonas sp. YSD2104]